MVSKKVVKEIHGTSIAYNLMTVANFHCLALCFGFFPFMENFPPIIIFVLKEYCQFWDIYQKY